MMFAAGIALWSMAIALFAWLAARARKQTPAPDPQTIRNAEADAVQARVQAQEQALQEIADDVHNFDLASYLNDPRKDN